MTILTNVRNAGSGSVNIIAGWDGLETATKVREVDKNIEIVIMTAYADHDQAQIAEQVGMPEKLLYIKKPFGKKEVSTLLEEATREGARPPWTIGRT